MEVGKSTNRAVRTAQIKSELAEMKRAFFVDGVEKPMSIRASLEAELAALRLETAVHKEAYNNRAMEVRKLRGRLMHERLVAMGYPTLIDECNAQAEAQIPA